MKLKNLFTTLGLAAVLGIGVGVGLTNKQNNREVKADEVPETLYFTWTASAWENWGAGIDYLHAHFIDSEGNGLGIWQDEGELKDGTEVKDSVTYATFVVPTDAVKVVFYVYGTPGWKYNDWEHKTQDLVIPTDGKETFTMTTRDDSTDWRWNGAWSRLSSQKYTVTKTAIEFSNGVATGNTWTIGSEFVEEGATYEVPASPDAVNLEHFVGWYSDETCETALVPQTITAATTIYAKFNKLAVDSYFYWISESSEPVFDHVYFFNEYQTTSWPGDEIADYEVSGVLTFNGLSQKIYKIPVPSEGDVAVILNNNNNKQTYDMYDIERRAGYYTWLEAGQSKYSYNANSDAGAALDLLLRAENIRNSVKKDDGAPANYSVCGISASDAASLYNEYFALSDGAKGMVDNTTTYTYNGTDVDPEHQTGVSYQAIMNQLREIAQKGGQNVSASNSFGVNENDFTAIIVVVIAITSVLACGTMLIIKRRKQLNK